MWMRILDSPAPTSSAAVEGVRAGCCTTLWTRACGLLLLLRQLLLRLVTAHVWLLLHLRQRLPLDWAELDWAGPA